MTPPNDMPADTDDVLFQQITRLIIENRNEDGVIDIDGQYETRDDIMQLIAARDNEIRIMGKTVEEVYTILRALEIERITSIEVTMSNLDKLYAQLLKDMRQANQKAISAAFSNFTNPNQQTGEK